MIRGLGVLLVLAPAALQAQAATDVTTHPRLAEVRTTIAAEWGVASDAMRLSLLGDVPEVVDSVAIEPGSSDRWILSMWSGDRITRRFLRAGVDTPVPTAARPLDRGVRVEADDVVTRLTTVWGMPVPHDDPVGSETQRMVAPGEPLLPPAVRPPLLIKGGDQVEAVYRQTGISVTVRGEALGRARAGDVVMVRLRSGVRISGRAVGPGRVEMVGGGVR